MEIKITGSQPLDIKIDPKYIRECTIRISIKYRGLLPLYEEEFIEDLVDEICKD